MKPAGEFETSTKQAVQTAKSSLQDDLWDGRSSDEQRLGDAQGQFYAEEGLWLRAFTGSLCEGGH